MTLAQTTISEDALRPSSHSACEAPGAPARDSASLPSAESVASAPSVATLQDRAWPIHAEVAIGGVDVESLRAVVAAAPVGSVILVDGIAVASRGSSGLWRADT